MAAVHAFARDQATRGRALPAWVSVGELVAGGYIASSDVPAFDGMEFSFSLTPNETRPQDILIRVRLPDGSVIAQLGDGSIQQLPR
jgi:hypothetical protein